MTLKTNRRLLLVCGVSLLVGLMAAGAFAQTWETRVRFSLNTKLEIPGAILEPGDYVMRVLNQTTNRGCVQFLNTREDEIIATVPTIPHGRLNATEESRFTVYERPRGLPQVLKSVYLPEKFVGHDLVYTGVERLRLTQLKTRSLPSLALLGSPGSSGAGAKTNLP